MTYTFMGEQFRIAIAQSNVARVAALLDEGADLTHIDANGNDVLSYAMGTGANDATLKLLLDAGAAVTPAAPATSYPLFTAAYRGRLSACKELIDRGADVNRLCREDMTPLQAAIVRGRVDVFEYLIDAGADIHQTDSTKHTPLHWAARYFPEEVGLQMARKLVSLGAQSSCAPRDATGRYRTPFQHALEEGAAQIATFFLSDCGEDPEQLTLDGQTMLDIAYDEDTRSVVRSALTTKTVADNLRGQASSTPSSRQRISAPTL